MSNKEKTKVPKVINGYLSYISSIKGATQETVKAYASDLILFFRFLKIYSDDDTDGCTNFEEICIADIDVKFIREITLSDIYAFLSYLEIDRNNANSTRARKIACLKSFFRYAYKKAKIIDADIGLDLETPKISKKMPIYLSLDESRALLAAVSSRNTIRDRCIITLFLNTGMRLSELCSINISSIKGDMLTVLGKGNKERVIYLNVACLDEINKYLQVRKLKEEDIDLEHIDALFLSEQKTRISKRTVENIVQNAICRAGLSKKYSVHKLRHTAATLMYRAGADIRSLQSILGHESVATTQIYTHLEEDQLRYAVKMNPLNIQN